MIPNGGDPDAYPDGETHMTQAFKSVHQLIDRNLHTYKDSHPPYILHITDGANNDNLLVKEEFKKLTNLSTNYGNTLVCTAYIADNLIPQTNVFKWSGITETTIFSNDRASIAESLREISSHIPPKYLESLKQRGYVNFKQDAYLFFPGTDNAMVQMAMITTKSTGD